MHAYTCHSKVWNESSRASWGRTPAKNAVRGNLERGSLEHNLERFLAQLGWAVGRKGDVDRRDSDLIGDFGVER